MRKYEIHLPLDYSDGTPIEQEKIGRVREELLTEFGSFAVPQRRAWRYDGSGCVELLRIEIVTTDDKVTKKRLKEFKEQLKAFLPQVDILVTSHDLQVI